MAEHSVPYEDFGDEFRAFVESTLKEFNAVGMAVLLLHRDRTWANGFGFSDAYEKTPILPETLFFAASTTKAFTSAMAAHLAESDEHPNIKWETPIVDLIGDDFVLDQTSPEGRWATKHVTLEDALSHRTGMARHDMIWTNGMCPHMRDTPGQPHLLAGFSLLHIFPKTDHIDRSAVT